jgi:predicted exporter
VNARTRGLLLILWLAALAALGAFVITGLRVETDLRAFLPPPRTPVQRLLLDQIGKGPGSRLLLLAIRGAPPADLARLSHGLAAALARDPRFVLVANGDGNLLATLDPALLPYRYLLSPRFDTHPLDAITLRAALQQRLADLGSPAASLLEPLLPSDPTLETLALAQRWAPPQAPALHDGVWLSPRHGALLVAQTRAPGFDPAGQASSLAALRAHFAALPARGAARLEVSGPGYFSVVVDRAVRRSADRIGALTTLGFVLLLLAAYRSVPSLLLGALPVATGALAGLAALVLIDGGAHGITLAFGFTLLGVAQEYPIRLLSHRSAAETATASARALWPLLRTAIASTAIAYAAFYASGVPGLQQLAVFAVAGVLAAGLATRWLLPPLLPSRVRDAADTPGLAWLATRLDALPRPRALPALLLLAALAAIALAPGPFWQNDLGALTPVPPVLLARDAALRQALGAPDVRYQLLLQAPTADAVLTLSERVTPALDDLVKRGVLGAAELPSRYLPSLGMQRARQARLPDRTALTADLAAAGRGLPFRPGLFAPFIRDVERARALPPLTPAAFERTPPGARLASMLVNQDGQWYGLGTLVDVRDPQALAAWARTRRGVRLLDLKATSEQWVAAYRARILEALAGSALLLVLAVTLALHGPRRAWHVLAPMTLATLLALATLRIAGIALTLFHLVALILAAGLGLHYALFFERDSDDPAERRRTLHATLVCVAAALLVFGSLAGSSVPVLRAIGLTVALGVGYHFALSLLMAPHRRAPGADR